MDVSLQNNHNAFVDRPDRPTVTPGKSRVPTSGGIPPYPDTEATLIVNDTHPSAFPDHSGQSQLRCLQEAQRCLADPTHKPVSSSAGMVSFLNPRTLYSY